jgi:hypothetical protein
MLLVESFGEELLTVLITEFGQEGVLGYSHPRSRIQLIPTSHTMGTRVKAREVKGPQRHSAGKPFVASLVEPTFVKVPIGHVYPGIPHYPVGEEGRNKIEPALLVEAHSRRVEHTFPSEAVFKELQEVATVPPHAEHPGIEHPSPENRGFIRVLPISGDGSQHMRHQNDPLSGSVNLVVKAVVDDEVAVDVQHRIGTLRKKMLKYPGLDDRDELAPKEHGHAMNLTLVEIEVTQTQSEKRLICVNDLMIEIIDQERPEPLTRVMLSVRSSKHAGVGHVCPRDDRISDHACCTFLRADNWKSPSADAFSGEW